MIKCGNLLTVNSFSSFLEIAHRSQRKGKHNYISALHFLYLFFGASLQKLLHSSTNNIQSFGILSFGWKDNQLYGTTISEMVKKRMS